MLYPPTSRGLFGGIRGVCGDTSATSAGTAFKYLSYISGKCSLLSKGLRGGMSRSDRVESLLRRMIASEDAKNPLQVCKQSRVPRIWPCHIRQEEGDDLVESGEFAETQVQRPPEQHSSISPYISGKWPLLSKGLRGGKSRRLRMESFSRRMLQSARSK